MTYYLTTFDAVVIVSTAVAFVCVLLAIGIHVLVGFGLSSRMGRWVNRKAWLALEWITRRIGLGHWYFFEHRGQISDPYVVGFWNPHDPHCALGSSEILIPLDWIERMAHRVARKKGRYFAVELLCDEGSEKIAPCYLLPVRSLRHVDPSLPVYFGVCTPLDFLHVRARYLTNRTRYWNECLLGSD